MKGGKLVYKNKWFNNKVHTGGQGGMLGKGASKDVFIFVQDTNGRMFVARGDPGKIHHSSFVQKNASGNKEVWMAGEIMVDKGVIRGVNNRSGHFLPDPTYLDDFHNHLKNVGANLNQAVFLDRNFSEGFVGNYGAGSRVVKMASSVQYLHAPSYNVPPSAQDSAQPATTQDDNQDEYITSNIE